MTPSFSRNLPSTWRVGRLVMTRKSFTNKYVKGQMDDEFKSKMFGQRLWSDVVHIQRFTRLLFYFRQVRRSFKPDCFICWEVLIRDFIDFTTVYNHFIPLTQYQIWLPRTGHPEPYPNPTITASTTLYTRSLRCGVCFWLVVFFIVFVDIWRW